MKEKRNTFNLRFFIKKHRVNARGEAPMYLRITVNGKTLDMSIHRYIEPESWNNKTGTATGFTKNVRSINNYLFSVQNTFYEHFKYLRETNKDLKPIDLKNAYLGIEEKGVTILEMYKEHNDNATKLIGVDYTYDTVQRHTTTYRHLEEFMKYQYNIDDIEVSRIDHKFINDLMMYYKIEKRISHNTTIKYLKNLKKIILHAIATGVINRNPYVNIKMKTKKIERDFLTDEELQAIMKKQFTTKRLEQVRDTFVFSCFTGLAHADLKRLTPKNIKIGTDGGMWIKTHRKKTNGVSNIPILPITEKLIEKYKDNPYCIEKEVLLPVLTNQKMNAYLKEIADLCGIEKNLTSHIARHTFATTVTLNNDVPIETVSKMLGHSSINMTKIYARLLDKKVGRDMEHLHDKFDMVI